MTKSIYVVGGAINYANYFIRAGWSLTEDMKAADLVMFTGGEDVSPILYNQEKHPRTWASKYRDAEEVAEYKKAAELGKPMIGICRGAQFLTVMAGGKLIQDVTNHAIGGRHLMTLADDRTFPINSLHHQMCDPTGTEHEMIGWATHNQSSHYEGPNGDDVTPYHLYDDVVVEPEIFFYPKIKALGVQYHPEMLPEADAAVLIVLELVHDKFGL